MSETPANNGFAAQWVKVQESVAVFVAASGPGFHDTEDLVQKVATTAFEKYDQYDPERGSFLGWVVGIARHQVLHWRRSVARDRLVFPENVVEIMATAQARQGEAAPEIGAAVARCIEEVKGRAQQVLEMRYLEDLKPAEIAERLETTSPSIRVTLSRARQALKKCVQRRLGLGEDKL